MLVRNYFKFIIWIGFIALLSSCEEEINTVAEFSELNDQEIQQYIQDNNINATGTDSGLFYEITSSTNGQAIEDGDSVTIHFVATLVNGFIVDSTSRFFDRPDGILMGITNIPFGLFEGIKLMKEGETATLLVPSYIGYGANAGSPVPPPNLPPFSTIVYEVEVIDVRSEEEQINDFLAELPFAQPTETIQDSLFLYRIADGSPNTLPDLGQELRVAYRGFLLDGTEFDSNLDSTFTFNLGLGQVIRAWDLGFELMNEGDSALFVINSNAGYGSAGNNFNAANGTGIPPFAPLAFEVTLVKSENQQIFEYISDQGLQNDTSSTDSGLFFADLQAGTGGTPDESSSVTVNLKASYINYQDQLVEFFDLPSVTFNLATDDQTDDLTTGLREGLQLMQVGGRSVLMMPSRLAYSANGNSEDPFVLGRAPVIYEVELISIQ